MTRAIPPMSRMEPTVGIPTMILRATPTESLGDENETITTTISPPLGWSIVNVPVVPVSMDRPERALTFPELHRFEQAAAARVTVVPPLIVQYIVTGIVPVSEYPPTLNT